MPVSGSSADVVRPPMTLFERVRLHPKMIILVVVCLCLGGILGVALKGEVTYTRKPVAASRALEPTRPPLSPADFSLSFPVRVTSVPAGSGTATFTGSVWNLRPTPDQMTLAVDQYSGWPTDFPAA